MLPFTIHTARYTALSLSSPWSSRKARKSTISITVNKAVRIHSTLEAGRVRLLGCPSAQVPHYGSTHKGTIHAVVVCILCGVELERVCVCQTRDSGRVASSVSGLERHLQYGWAAAPVERLESLPPREARVDGGRKGARRHYLSGDNTRHAWSKGKGTGAKGRGAGRGGEEWGGVGLCGGGRVRLLAA